MTDPQTGQSRRYGFARFRQQRDQFQALDEMQGCIIGNRPIRVSAATPKLSCTLPSTSPPLLPRQPANHVNTTVFVGGLSCPLKEEELRQYFEIFGEIVYVKIPPGKGCGFVQFVSRQSAEVAMEEMNGYQIGSSRIRLSWGRSHQHNIQQQRPSLLEYNQARSLDDMLLSSLYNKRRLPQTHQQQALSPFDDDGVFDTSFTRMTDLQQANTNKTINTSVLWAIDLKPIFAQAI
ncbi:vacuolar protein sorting-associated protein 1 [Mucor velutinosus]|uniref:Vacuolar protein sorting-associated protein 1 n=1 Tax=Mucor velutinosus TaxID=708070 RepID=A0AAN7D9U1_9FUNG|nr:vacuolar protein sorting-associated protein 1 [Mucor velutinosus]